VRWFLTQTSEDEDEGLEQDIREIKSLLAWNDDES